MSYRVGFTALTLACSLSSTIAGAQTATSTPAATAAAGQSTAASADSAADTRPSLPTVYGDTGIWFVPTGETLPAKRFSFSLFRSDVQRSQGLTDIANIGLTVGAGLTDRVEVFGSWGVIRERRDVRNPLFVPSDVVHGGVDPEHPFVKDGWSKTLGAPLTVGIKAGLLSQSRNNGIALALRGTLMLPTGPQAGGTDSLVGRFDLIVSREAAKKVEITGTVGGVFRGSPDAFMLANGMAWGFGTQFPSRSRIRGLFEVSGEWLTNDSITALGPFVANDRSVAPTLSAIRSPADFKGGIVWQDRRGFFLHGGFNYSVNAQDRLVGGQSISHSGWGYEVRVGFHPGVKAYNPPPPPPPPPPAPPAAAAPPPPTPPTVRQNRVPTVSVQCDPCTVEPGQTSTLRANAADADGDRLTYRWNAPTGTFQNGDAAQTTWTAPQQEGTVAVSVTVDDGQGGSVSGSVNMQVARPAPRTFMFDDVLFDFDRSTLRPEGIAVLDEVVRTLQGDARLQAQIDGHTDSVGTNEYNLALGERRAAAVRNYLINRGIPAARLQTISYGEERPKADNSTAEGRQINRRAATIVTVR